MNTTEHSAGLYESAGLLAEKGRHTRDIFNCKILYHSVQNLVLSYSESAWPYTPHFINHQISTTQHAQPNTIPPSPLHPTANLSALLMRSQLLHELCATSWKLLVMTMTNCMHPLGTVVENLSIVGTHVSASWDSHLPKRVLFAAAGRALRLSSTPLPDVQIFQAGPAGPGRTHGVFA